MTDSLFERMRRVQSQTDQPTRLEVTPEEIIRCARILAKSDGLGDHMPDECLAGWKRHGRIMAKEIADDRLAHTVPGDAIHEAIKHAYLKGATDVHNYWTENPGEAPRGDPEFGEAASDYASAAMDLFDSSAFGPGLSTSPVIDTNGGLAERGWQPRIGEEVRVAEHIAEKWPEWRGIPLWVTGVVADRNFGMGLVGGLNVTVSDEWPVTSKTPGFTDGFYINRSGDEDDLRPIARASLDQG